MLTRTLLALLGLAGSAAATAACGGHAHAAAVAGGRVADGLTIATILAVAVGTILTIEHLFYWLYRIFCILFLWSPKKQEPSPFFSLKRKFTCGCCGGSCAQCGSCGRHSCGSCARCGSCGCYGSYDGPFLYFQLRFSFHVSSSNTAKSNPSCSKPIEPPTKCPWSCSTAR